MSPDLLRELGRLFAAEADRQRDNMPEANRLLQISDECFDDARRREHFEQDPDANAA